MARIQTWGDYLNELETRPIGRRQKIDWLRLEADIHKALVDVRTGDMSPAGGIEIIDELMGSHLGRGFVFDEFSFEGQEALDVTYAAFPVG